MTLETRLGASLAIALVLVSAAASGQGRSGNDSEEEQTLKAAETAFNANRYDEAAGLYEKVTAINPARPEPWVKRAVILYRKKQYTDSVRLLRTAQQTLPGDLGIKAQLGLALYKSGAVDMAVAMMEEVARERPEMSELQLQLALHYVKIGDGKRAVSAIEAYFKTRPEEAAKADLSLRPLAGTAYLLNRQFPEAEREFETVLRHSPTDVVAHASLGQVFAAKGDCSKAITHYEQVIVEATRRPFIEADLSVCYLKVGRRVESLKAAEAYHALRPKEAKGFILLGDARFENHDPMGALTAFEEARKLDPRALVDARMGRVYLAQKNYPAAVEVLKRASTATPEDLEIESRLVDAWAAIGAPRAKLIAAGEKLANAADPEKLTAAGVAFYTAGDDWRAAKLFEAALALDGKARRARNGLAMALIRSAHAEIDQGEFANAEAALERAQRLDPESIQANRNLGLALLLEKKYPQAEKALEPALKRVPHDVVINRLLARAFLGMKRRDDALKAWDTAAQTALRTRGPALAEVYTELGPALMDAGRFDEAVGVLETAVREAGQTASLGPAQRNLLVAHYRRGIDRLKDPKQADAAYDDLAVVAAAAKGTLSQREQNAVVCTAALAALAAGKNAQAQEALGRVGKEGCQFKPPFEKVGVEFFTAYADYRDTQNPAKREAAAHTFQRLESRSTGALAVLLRDLVRSSFELQSYDLYQRGDEKRSSVALRSAARMAGKEHRELDNNLAVIEVAEGRYAGAEKVFEALGARPPEALVNLGILVDRQGDAKRALELYRRANERGARAPKLREWIDVKERLLSGGQAGVSQ